MASNYHVGQRVSFQNALCTIRYIGPVEGTGKDWLGVEWDDPHRGKNDGTLKGVNYFQCRSRSKTAASFVRPTRYAEPEQSFVEAIHQKYATEITGHALSGPEETQHIISGKVVEEVGFDKIRQQLAQLQDLKIVIVDGMGINSAETETLKIRDVCPSIQELDLSRNLFEFFEDIVYICGELDSLRNLRINGNRFSAGIVDEESCHKKLLEIVDLEMDDVLMPWDDICSVAQHFMSLKALTVSSNRLNYITSTLLTPNLTSLTLEYNIFTALSELSPLAAMESLEVLLLKGNLISQISTRHDKRHPTFNTKLKYVDLSYNAVKSWEFVDSLAEIFPGLEALRFSHNPVYESSSEEFGSARGVEEGYMHTLARLGNLKTLNFSKITTADRTNAEMYYLSKIGKAMGAVPESEEISITTQHRRYAELCEIYGEPHVVRKSADTVNPNFLEARLIKFKFYMPAQSQLDQTEDLTIEREIPKSFDIYRVKGIVGRAYNLPPLSLHLVWETGEWDPVAGYEDEENSDEEDDEAKDVASNDKGKWMKREVEIEDGTRQIGFCVDGMEATIRVELR